MLRTTCRLLPLTILLFCLSRCAENPTVSDGEALARTHCASCHAYPEPGVLDKKSWNRYVLPRMGALMGVLPLDSAGGRFIEPDILKTDNPAVFRKAPVLTLGEWAAIRRFFLKNAPQNLPAPAILPMEKALPQFRARFPEHYLSPPGSLLVNISDGNLTLGDVHTGKLYQFDNQFVVKKIAIVPGGAVCLNRLPEGDLVTCIGSFSPSDQATGSVLFFPKKEKAAPLTLVDNLRRPVHTAVADLDADGRFDLVISEFGKWAGSLNWWKNDGRGGFTKQPLRAMPGAIRSAISDLNGDGLPDITALFGQGDEGIFTFLNRGGGNFEERRLLRFPPGYGSSHFELFDFNGDGHSDIIYACGDNADFPPVVKPYHGVRVFENDGMGNFSEVLFLPLPGAYAAIPADFDLDGDVDIAAISFFPDFEKMPEAGFVFFENQGNRKFQAFTFLQSVKGRWLVMDAGDLDADGDLDLVLGNMAFEVIPDRGEVAKWAKEGIPFVVLENRTK
jgi:hypothetical protein